MVVMCLVSVVLRQEVGKSAAREEQINASQTVGAAVLVCALHSGSEVARKMGKMGQSQSR